MKDYFLQYKLREHSYIITAYPDNIEVEVNGEKVGKLKEIRGCCRSLIEKYGALVGGRWLPDLEGKPLSLQGLALLSRLKGI